MPQNSKNFALHNSLQSFEVSIKFQQNEKQQQNNILLSPNLIYGMLLHPHILNYLES